jgi:hypothetical protein
MYSKLLVSLAAAVILQCQLCLARPNVTAVVLGASPAIGITNFDNATVHPPRGGAAVCVSGIVQVHAATTKNFKYNYVLPQNQSQVTELTIDMLTVNSSFVEDITTGTQDVNGTFKIGATLCLPNNSTIPAQVQILTHGFGFDRYYWVRSGDCVSPIDLRLTVSRTLRQDIAGWMSRRSTVKRRKPFCTVEEVRLLIRAQLFL